MPKGTVSCLHVTLNVSPEGINPSVALHFIPYSVQTESRMLCISLMQPLKYLETLIEMGQKEKCLPKQGFLAC